jgi:hypothetical protein
MIDPGSELPGIGVSETLGLRLLDVSARAVGAGVPSPALGSLEDSEDEPAAAGNAVGEEGGCSASAEGAAATPEAVVSPPHAAASANNIAISNVIAIEARLRRTNLVPISIRNPNWFCSDLERRSQLTTAPFQIFHDLIRPSY